MNNKKSDLIIFKIPARLLPLINHVNIFQEFNIYNQGSSRKNCQQTIRNIVQIAQLTHPLLTSNELDDLASLTQHFYKLRNLGTAAKIKDFSKIPNYKWPNISSFLNFLNVMLDTSEFTKYTSNNWQPFKDIEPDEIRAFVLCFNDLDRFFYSKVAYTEVSQQKSIKLLKRAFLIK